jgi:toxin ParE1/3/4
MVPCMHTALERHDTVSRIDNGLEPVRILSRSPLIGRSVGNGKRELIIGKGNRSHVALQDGRETVFILALRAQRESGFKH